MPYVPLVAIALGAYLAGLLLGFAEWTTLGIIVGLVLCAAALLRSHPRLGAFGALLLAGTLVAVTERTEADRCIRRAGLEGTRYRLLTEGSRGTVAQARVVGCPLRAALLVRDGKASAGSIVDARGEVSTNSSGVFIRDASIRIVNGPSLLDRMRQRATARIDRAFGSDAPLARALLVADMRGLAPELKDRFAVSGLAHILSISGLHVGIIAVAIELVLSAMRVSKRRAPAIALALVAVYVAMLGAPPPAVRAAVMLGVQLVSKLLQRPTTPWAALALGAMHPVFAPSVVTDLGYQLSVVGVAALIAGGVVVRRLRIPTRPKWRKEILAGMLCSTVATVASAPLVLWSFGRVSLIAPLSNLVAAPIVAVLQPVLFLAMALGPIEPAARFVADAAHPLLWALDLTAAVSASVPGAALVAWPTPLVGALVTVACLATLTSCVHHRPVRPAAVGAGALAVIAWSSALPAGSGRTELHMIDVGQGDAVALRTPQGRWILFDAGRSWPGGDAGRSTVVPYIARRGGDVELFILSHPHTDHVGGAASTIAALHPRRYLDAAFAMPNGSYRASLMAARSSRTRWARVHPADSMVVDGVVLTMLGPDSAWTESLADPNNASVAVLARMGSVRMLFVGDAEASEEEWLIARWGETLRADVLKVGHHGSSTSTTPPFLAAVEPRVAVISVGAGNSYGHPSADVLDALVDRGATVLRTDKSGSIVVSTDGRRLWVTTSDGEWEIDRARPGNR